MTGILDFLRLFSAFFCWLLVWCLAFWRGRWPERTFAGVSLALGILTAIVRRPEHHGAFDWGSFLTDVGLFATLLFLAIRGQRLWPVPAAGFQLIAVLTHFVILLKNPGSTFAYISVSVLATWLVLVAFAAGLWENEVRRRLEREVARLDLDPTPP